MYVPDEVVKLIASFHHRMQAKIRLDGSVLEQFEVSNGLRQGCCMAPVLFNLFSCLVIERLRAKLEEVEGIGVDLHFKYDEKLFRRYTRNAQVRLLTECLFTDDGALLATSRSGSAGVQECWISVWPDCQCQEDQAYGGRETGG